MNRLLSHSVPLLPWLLLTKLAIKASIMAMEQNITLPCPTMPLTTIQLLLTTDLPQSITSLLLVTSLPPVAPSYAPAPPAPKAAEPAAEDPTDEINLRAGAPADTPEPAAPVYEPAPAPVYKPAPGKFM